MENNTELDILRKKWGWIFVFGIVLMILGVMAIGSPVATTLAIEILLGWIFIIAGIAQALNTLSCWRRGGFIMSLLGTGLFVVIGVLLLTRPMQGVLTLTMLLVIYFLIGGIFKIILALRLRGLSNWGWVFFNGLISLLLAILIWREWPSSARWVIGLLVGIEILIGGWVMILISLTARKTLK